MDDEKGKFKVVKITKLYDLANKKGETLIESDLTIQTNDQLIQLSYEENEREKKKYIIKPGCFYIQETGIGTILNKFELRKYDLLDTIDNTSRIIAESNKFFNRLYIYKKLNKPPKRSLLICSIPGVGKTAAINKVCRGYLEGNNGTCVIVWDTSDTRASAVNRFFLNSSRFNKKVTRLVMVIEDINGGTTEGEDGQSKGVSSSLLNFLDGVGSPFQGIPTFIIATTNNPERSVGALIDRPGRFDKVIEMKAPNSKECIELLKFLSKKELSKEDIQAAELAAKKKFSIGHLDEIVVRSLLDDISMLEACKELVAHKKRFENAFQAEKSKIGLGF